MRTVLPALLTAKEYEWAGIFETPGNSYMWTAQKVNGEYADPAMKLVALPATDSSGQQLQDLEAEGNSALTLNCEEIVFGSTLLLLRYTFKLLLVIFSRGIKV